MEETKLTEPTMAEENKNKKEVVKYQWVKGERFGSIVIKAENQKDDKWLYFEDGSRINPELVDEFLLKIERPNQIFDVSQIGVNPTATPTPAAEPPIR